MLLLLICGSLFHTQEVGNNFQYKANYREHLKEVFKNFKYKKEDLNEIKILFSYNL